MNAAVLIVTVVVNTTTSYVVFDVVVVVVYYEGLGCSSVGKVSDRHAADSGLIPRCGKGFSSQSQLSVQTLSLCPYTQVCNRIHLYLCAR